MSDFPFLGFGLGLRAEYYKHFLSEKPAEVDWCEAITENYLALSNGEYGISLQRLEKVRANMPVVLHGVSLSLGSAEPLDVNYLRSWKDLIHRIEPAWVSDHLCWTSTDQHNVHDLLPLPFTEESIRVVSEKISKAQDYLGRRILIENVSAYLEFEDSEMFEWEFIAEILKRTGCGLLLDINNIYVSSFNQKFDPLTYLKAMPKESVGQIHLAGHHDRGTYKVDTHDEPICKEVWNLYRWAARYFSTTSVMIERDDDFPPWKTLIKELQKVKTIWIKENEVSRPSQITAAL